MSRRREIGALLGCRAVVIVAPVLALAVALAGCTATPGPAESPSAGERPVSAGGSTPAPESTTNWEAPDDPASKGPTEAPLLVEAEGALDEAVALPTEMVVAIDSTKTTDIVPETPGEYAGTAVIVSVSVKNTSDVVQNIDSAVVMVTADDGGVGVATTAGPNTPLQGDVAPGATAKGSYVFMLDPAKGRAVSISVNYAAGEPVARFNGTVP